MRDVAHAVKGVEEAGQLASCGNGLVADSVWRVGNAGTHCGSEMREIEAGLCGVVDFLFFTRESIALPIRAETGLRGSAMSQRESDDRRRCGLVC